LSDGVREEFGIPADAPLVGTVANFRASKGHAILLEAAVQVRRVVPEVRFLLVGHGPLEMDIRRRTRDLGLEGTVIFAGSREDAPRLAGAFDVFALSSVYEGLAIALIEAMALGKPAVVTGVGGLTEVVEHGKQALVVDPGDPKPLADAIVTLLQDGDLRRRLGEAARQRAARFDIRKAVRRLEEVYTELLS
jgi:glycosyltransferase involved in cell wall biosynthesis